MSPRADVDLVGSSMVTAWPVKASSIFGPPGPHTALTVVENPDGSTVTSSPGLNVPPATVPA